MTTNIIASWFSVPSDGAHFPGVGRYGSSRGYLSTYLKCCVVFYASVVKHNKDKNLQIHFYINELSVLRDAEFDYGEILGRLGVKIFHFDSTHNVDLHHEGLFFGVLNQLDVMQCIEEAMDGSYNLLLLDNDCVVNGSLAPVFADIENSGCCFMKMSAGRIDEEIQGISGGDVVQMSNLYASLMGDVPVRSEYIHVGGEFLAVNRESLIKLNSFSTKMHEIGLELKRSGKPCFFTEEQYFSHLLRVGVVPESWIWYAGRLWTDPATFRNFRESDFELLIMHLPGEKKVGFEYLFNKIKIIPLNDLCNFVCSADFLNFDDLRVLCRY